MTRLARAVLRWKAARPMRIVSRGVSWHPDPPSRVQRLRQAACFLWRHRTQMKFDPIETPEDAEHPGVTISCLRCGLRWGYCLVHDGVGVPDDEGREQEE